jgi:hypothetical protein
LGAAGVLDGLRGEEEVFWGCLVVGSVEGGGGVGGTAGCFAGPFEEEDYAVDGSGIVSLVRMS